MGPVIGFKMGPCRKSRLFEGPSIFLGPKMALGWRLVPFNGPKKSWAPRKGEIFCKDPFWNLLPAPFWNLLPAPFCDFVGSILQNKPGLQHRSIGILMQPVSTIFVGFISIFGLFDTPPPPIFEFCPVLYSLQPAILWNSGKTFTIGECFNY